VRTRILIVDDHKIVRQGLRSLIEGEDGMEVVGEAADGWTALQLVLKLAPDVVIMDITMPDLNGIDATREIIAENPYVKVIALSMHSDRHFVAGMFGARASGFVLKDCAFEELLRAIHTVVLNKTYLSPAIADVVIEDYIGSLAKTGSRAVFTLTLREREVLQLLAEGKSTKQIATRVHLSVKTVETHRKHIMDKLNIHNVAALTKYAIRHGLTALET
jgi:two-component system response regulator NreC